MRIVLACLMLICLFQAPFLQTNKPSATSALQRLSGVEQRKHLRNHSLCAQVPFHNIGPTIFSGRVVDLEVNPKDPTRFYVAYASGGLWYTQNNGNTFKPIFDQEAVMTIGDIAVNWNTNTIWVGTGENNSSRSSYSGVGMYQSTDGGDSWTHKGLPESHHIGRIVLDMRDPHTLYVAVLGHLYSSNPQRGVYKSTDDGTSWRRVLFVSDSCGAIDLVADPANPAILYAATWERSRKAWDFVESGAGSAIYKSTDSGETWTLITPGDDGFPAGEGVGRIGLGIVAQDTSESWLYAVIDNYFRQEPEPPDTNVLTRNALRNMPTEAFLRLDTVLLSDFLEDNNFPEEITADSIMQMVADSTIQPNTLAEYLEDANAMLFDTDVIGAEVYVSKDGGVSWTRTHSEPIDGLYYTYGYYFGQIRVSPFDANRVYILGVPILLSEDGGATWRPIEGDNVHGDHHALWLSDHREGHIILGNDGGVNISYDDGENWFKCNSPPVGQFYSVTTDRADDYNVYGGLQDNGVWGGSHNYRRGTRWHSLGDYPYDMILGGDGMQVQVDFRDNRTVYTGFQFGNYYRIDKETGKSTRITPGHALTERPYRWNWQSPIHLSRHQQDILYMGSNFVHRSLNQGKDFEKISDDLTKGGVPGDVPYGTLTTIDESPIRFGLLYVGSDDGLIHVTKDMGLHWERITNALPADMWVSRVVASRYTEGRVYVALNGYRWDDFRSLIYVSENYGDIWRPIGQNLPQEPVNVILEDPHNPDILYVGTDHCLYVTLDRGRNFMVLGDLPAVPVHDLSLHPDERELVVATHGRSFYLADVSPVEHLTDDILAKDVYIFHIPGSGIRYSDRWGTRRASWTDFRTPELTVPFYVAEASSLAWEVVQDTITLSSGEITSSPGINYITYDLAVDSTAQEMYMHKPLEDSSTPTAADNGLVYLRPGSYTFRIASDQGMSERTFEIR